MSMEKSKIKTIDTEEVFTVENCGEPVLPGVLFYSAEDAVTYLQEEGYEDEDIQEMTILPLYDSLATLLM